MTHDPYAIVGRVAKTHGLKGEVSVVNATETLLHSLEGTEVWFVPPPSGRRTARLTASRQGPKGTLVSFEGVTSIDEARALVGRDILVLRQALPESWGAPIETDCTGYHVVDTVHGDIGTVDETLVTGANDVWIVLGSYGEVLVPVIEDVVIDVDDDARTIAVHLLPGLLPQEAGES